jgi:hypothetical protein
MSLLDRAPARPDPLDPGGATMRRLERAWRGIEPDPLFRRRLRGEIVNRYVAEREGQLPHQAPRRQMGALGRAALYASLGLAIGVSAAGAAADRALPGDVLYAVKLELEDVRMRIAPPSVRDELAAMALGERVEELERLAAAGSWQLLPAAAARVVDAEEALAATGPGGAGAAAATSRASEVLTTLLAEVPAEAQQGVARALDAVEGHEPSTPHERPVPPTLPEAATPKRAVHVPRGRAPEATGDDRSSDDRGTDDRPSGDGPGRGAADGREPSSARGGESRPQNPERPEPPRGRP